MLDSITKAKNKLASCSFFSCQHKPWKESISLRFPRIGTKVTCSLSSLLIGFQIPGLWCQAKTPGWAEWKLLLVAWEGIGWLTCLQWAGSIKSLYNPMCLCQSVSSAATGKWLWGSRLRQMSVLCIRHRRSVLSYATSRLLTANIVVVSQNAFWTAMEIILSSGLTFSNSCLPFKTSHHITSPCLLFLI